MFFFGTYSLSTTQLNVFFFVYINGIVSGTARKLHNPQTCVREIDL